MDENLKYWVECLEENEQDVCNEAQVALLNICYNLLISPDNEKFREVRFDSETTVRKILPAIGAMECLLEVGYVEDGERLFFPHNASLSRIQQLSQMLSNKLQKRATKSQEPVDKKKFFKQILTHFNNVMLYENEELQNEALKLIPVDMLETKSVRIFRELQRSYKVVDSTAGISLDIEEDLSLRDFLLVTFTSWFKQEFFQWFDSPTCSVCSIKCTYTDTVHSFDIQCSRIELYKCTKCNKTAKFPRYSHPRPLLTTRRGRCGEWANVYTLMCRALKYDARLIYDETDHAWTEVWSPTQKKWIHVDPCENVVNKPLMYERGWKKELTYIIAYSRDEVQDVTWRYTRQLEAVLKRRKMCTEQALIKLIRFLSYKRQSAVSYGETRRTYVVNRTLRELASMIYTPNSQDDNKETYEGRSSGALAWRLARGELTVDEDELNKFIEKNYIWDISKYGQTFQLQYNVVKDMYQVVQSDGIPLEQISGWLEGVNSTCGRVFRKEEHDWKVVYLARSQGVKCGCVTWTFKIANPQLCIETFNLRAKSRIFHEASVLWEIEAIFDDNKTVTIPVTRGSNFHTKEVENAVRLNLSVKLYGGEGEQAWQHAQIFRQVMEDSEEPSMIVTIQLKNQCI